MMRKEKVVSLYEEKIVNGILCHRSNQKCEWHPFSQRELTRIIVDLKNSQGSPALLSLPAPEGAEEMNEEEFSNKYPVGTPIRYHPVIGQERVVDAAIRSEAWRLDSGSIVVKITGRAGGVSIRAIEPTPEGAE